MSDQLINGRFRRLVDLGKGGMGWTVSAEDTRLKGHIVALKFLYSHLLEKESSLVRFRNEVLLSRKLVHPNIVRTFNFATDPVLGHNIVMEYVQGQTLGSLLESEPQIELERAIRIFHQILSSVQYAHSCGIIHLDLKPDNVLLNTDDDCKLADFGLAQPLRINGTGAQILGTPVYMAPEQFQGSGLSRATDIYSLGILGFELVTGRPPFEDSTYYNLAQQHLEKQLPNPCLFRPELPEPLAQLLMNCCKKNPEERPGSISELMPSVEEFLPEVQRPIIHSTQFVHDSPRSRWISFVERHARNPIIRWSGLVIFLFVFIYYWRMDGRLHEELGYYTLLFETKTGVRAPIFRKIFRITVDQNVPLTDAIHRFDEGYARLRLGENPNTPDAMGRLPLVSATGSSKSEKIIRLLLQYGANPNLQDSIGRTPLHTVISSYQIPLAALLIKAGANPNLRDYTGATPMLQATRRRNVDVLRFFLSHGADPNIPDASGETALELAERTNDARTAGILRAWGARSAEKAP